MISLLSILFMAVVVDYLSEFISEAKVFNRLKEWLEDRSEWWHDFFFCKFCLGFKISLVVNYINPWQNFDSLNRWEIFVFYIGTSFLVHWISIALSGLISWAKLQEYRLYKIRGAETPERLKTGSYEVKL